MMARLDLAAIRAANPLPGVAARYVRLRRAGGELLGCCPFHDDRSPSFTIFDGGARFHCFGCGATGDVLDFIQRIDGVGLIEAAKLLDAGVGRCRDLHPPAANPYTVKDRARETAALAIWRGAQPAARTLAEAYLRLRGIDPPYPPTLRFQRLSCGTMGALPCLVCAVQDMAGAVTGIQRIWLAGDGRGKANVPQPKKSLGRVKAGAIRLGDLDGTGVVTVCEGPEDGLSLLAMLGGAVWAAAGASFQPAMQFPPGVHSIIIGSDNDAAGRASARDAANAFAARGLTVRIIRPLDGFKDFNEELTGAEHGR